MSEESKNWIKEAKEYFECFKQRFLIGKKSIFRLDANEEKDKILNSDSIQYLMDNFVNKGLEGDVSFIDKIKLQLLGENKINSNELKLDLIYPNNISDENQKKQIQKNAIEVLAHCVWLWRLVPYNAKMESTKKSVKEILDLNEDLKNIDFKNNNFFNPYIKGIASTGTYYNTNKPIELAFIIKFLKKYLIKQENKNEIDILKSLNQEFNFMTIGKISKNGKYDEFKSKKEEKRNASIFNALLFFFNPENYEPIISNSHKEKIVETFNDLIDNNTDLDLDQKIKKIREKIDSKQSYQGIAFFYQPYIRKLWDKESIDINKNIIYYGVPGTGKTYKVLKEVKELTENDEKYYKLVQFHPSYTYEDFIDGVKPVGINDNGQMQFELKNGVFKQICIDAFKELVEAQNNRKPKKFYFIADEINRAELSRVFGELLLCLEEDKRLKIKNDDSKLIVEGIKVKTANSMLWQAKDAIVIIKKDSNEIVTDIEENKEYDFYFGVPENVYFIGTMNDVDRSIESFDLALRRRFIWIKKRTDYKVIKEYLKEEYKLEDETFIKACKELNEKIKEIIGEKYQLGHSYFMKINPVGSIIPKISKKILFDVELKPILEEYLRSLGDEQSVEKNINQLEKVFIDETKK